MVVAAIWVKWYWTTRANAPHHWYEPVGEAMLAGSVAPGAVTTGVVQANAYKTTPAVSVVGGIVRRVAAELGQNVRQTIA